VQNHSRRSRRGVALLEALVALVMLMTAGATVMALAAEATHAAGHASATEKELRRANGLFEAVTLWPREDLDRHLGSHEQGPWRLDVERSAPTLYTLTLSDSLDARRILRTIVYRPESPRDTL
jgi:type II secretory pathway component PulK